MCEKKEWISRSYTLAESPWTHHSYDEINSIETKFTEDQANRREPRKFVPNNIQLIQPFVTFVYDNCDHNIEPIYNVTLHGTNGIIIQKCLSTTNNHINTNPPIKTFAAHPLNQYRMSYSHTSK